MCMTLSFLTFASESEVIGEQAVNCFGAVYIVRAQHRGEGGFSLAHPSTQGGRGGLGPAHMCIISKYPYYGT